MASRSVLITGCSSGIGLSAAVALATDPAGKFKVYATMRNTGKKADLEAGAGGALNKTLFIRELDVKNVETFKPVIDEIVESEGKLDILINNAGVGLFGIFEAISIDTIRNVMDTNFFGLVQLTQAVIPHMKKQKSGHIINVTSIAGISGTPYAEIYNASKFAVEGLTESLAPVLKADNIHCSLIEPGPVVTEFGDTVRSTTGTGVDSSDVDEQSKQRFHACMAKFMELIKTHKQTSSEIADVILRALTDETPHLRYQTSKYVEEVIKNLHVDIAGDTTVQVMGRLLTS